MTHAGGFLTLVLFKSEQPDQSVGFAWEGRLTRGMIG
jgi:hypothetical protein